MPEHLGDGVYVSHDGYYFNIAVNDHRNHVVAFEDQVIVALMNYVKSHHPALAQLIKEKL